MANFPTQARVIIVGGGIIGCSTAYHLAKHGCKDVVLLEQHKLTSGSTFHAAGLVGQLRSQASITQLLGRSIELYRSLQAETGLATGWKMNGGLRLACNAERMVEIKRQATTARSFGLEMHLLTPTEAQTLWPLMNIDDVVGAAFLPTDGQANPADITQALAKGARANGVQIIEDCKVSSVGISANRICSVKTPHGDIQCEILVNCCGQWAREFGALAGVNIPLISIQHQYLITEKIDGVESQLPTLRDPDRLTYYKEEVGGLVMGGYEANPISWSENGIPDNFNFSLLDSDWQHFEQLMTLALPRVPSLANVGIKELLNGPESFTPDGNFILGRAPEIDNYFVGAGFNAFGIAAGGGAGEALAQWIIENEPPYDLWAVDIRRFGVNHLNPQWVRARTMEMYGKHYAMAWPFEEHQSARPLRKSPLFETLRQAGACFGEKLGWERPNWFAPNIRLAKDEYSFARQNWFDHVGREHQAARERVVIIDQTSFAKFTIKGRDALKTMNWICANNVDRDPGKVIYTQMLNQRGGIECDLTVSRLSETEFYIVTGTGFATRDYNWIIQNIPASSDVVVEDITAHYSVLSLMGPRSRDVLTRVSDDDLSTQAMPFSTWRNISIAGVVVRALRITYVGELGWELHVPADSALQVYQELVAAGEIFEIANAGYRAIESLRLEKAYRAWGTDISPDYTPLEAGLGWAVKLATEIDFQGREAMQDQQDRLLEKQLVGFSVEDDDIILLGRETVFRDGVRVGWLSSGGYGYTVARNIGYGYVRNKLGVGRSYLENGQYELEVATQRVSCDIHLAPLYDPLMKKIKV